MLMALAARMRRAGPAGSRGNPTRSRKEPRGRVAGPLTWLGSPGLPGRAVRFAAVSVGCRGEPGADVAGLGGAEFGVEGESLPPVMAGPAGVTGGVIGAREAVVGAGLLVWVADLAGHGEGVVVVGAGLPGQARTGQGFPETVE